MRASRYGCATLFTIVGTLFLCCGLTLVQCAPFYAAGPNPGRVPVPIDTSVLLERDGVGLIASPTDSFCKEREIEAQESDTQVTLLAYDTPQPLAYCATPPLVPPLVGVVLPRPLGSRAVVDGRTGRRLPVFDQRRALSVPQPPAGWTGPAPWSRSYRTSAGQLRGRLHRPGRAPGRP